MNVEFKSKNDLVMFRNKWSNWWPKNTTPVLSRTSIRTLENSLLVLATYESEKSRGSSEKSRHFFKDNAEYTSN